VSCRVVSVAELRWSTRFSEHLPLNGFPRRVVEEVPDRLIACKGIEEAENAMAWEVEERSGLEARAGRRQQPTSTIAHQAEASRSASA
jgi:hypothetical protein